MKILLSLALLMVPATSVTVVAQSLIPAPVTVNVLSGTARGETFDLQRPTLTISYATPRLADAGLYLEQSLRQQHGLNTTLKTGKDGNIRLAISKKVGKAGAYKLNITNKGIDIVGADCEGVSNAIATLRQLLLQQGTALAATSIADQPHLSWRGFHLDSSRHFWTVPEVKRVIDVMALYKLNRFHWHLTDDQGWRIEIKKYPLLTERGAWRIFNDQDTACWTQAAKTQNPDMLVPRDRTKVVNGDTLYGGYYTQQDIREVVAYARQRGIEIVPEIDMPGHFLSAIENYEGLSCFPQAGWGEWFTTPLCPGKERVLEFCQDIWREVLPLFPYEYVHIGGDEVRKDTWQTCPDCQRRIKAEDLKDEDELQAWFIHQMEIFLNRQGKKMMGWDEILEGGLSPSATVSWWRTWVPDAPQRVMEQGNDVVFCPGSPMYLSQTEDKNNLRDIYEYALPTVQPSKLSTRRGHILGVQGNLWTEYIPTIERTFYMYFPRILALSELGWSDPKQKDFADFSARLPQHFDMLRKLGVAYRTPALNGFYAVNAFTSEGTLTATCTDPSATVHYTTDGTIPTAASPLYTSPIKVNTTTRFGLRTFQPNGRADETVFTDFVKQGYLEPVTSVVSPSSVVAPGLTAYWHDFRAYKCDEMHLTPVRQVFTIDDVCIPDSVTGHIGLIIKGFISIPADGIYTFALKSDDGSLLKIDGNMVVDNDRPQSPHEEISQQALRAGLHTLEVRYYDHNGGMLRLHVLNPDGQLMAPANLYRH